MMDGRVEAIKEALMAHGFGNRVGAGECGEGRWGGERAWTSPAPVSAKNHRTEDSTGEAFGISLNLCTSVGEIKAQSSKGARTQAL